MSANFFKINRGVNLDPQTQTGSSDPVGTDGDIYYNKVLDKFRKFENGSWSDIGGSSSTTNSRSGEVSIPSGATTVVVTFSSPVTSTSYAVLVDMVNTIDANPQFQQPIVTNKTVNGFTVVWNAPTDSANYAIDYIAPGNLISMAEVAVPLGATSLAITFNLPFTNTNYAVMGLLQDQVDPAPQFQTAIVTNKTTTGFTIQWNDPTDSANYVIAYQAMGYA